MSLLVLGCGLWSEPDPAAQLPPPRVPEGWLAFVRETDDVRRTCLVPARGGQTHCPQAARHAFPADPDPRGEQLLLVFAEDLQGGGHRERLGALGATGLVPLTPWAPMVRHPAWSSRGDSLVFESSAEGFRDLWTVGRDGTGLEAVVRHPAGNFEPDIAPDGTLAFVSSRTGDAELHTFVDDVTLLAAVPGDEQRPRWSPDGRVLAFLTAREGPRRVWRSRPDGTDPRPLVPEAQGEHHDLVWSPDGRSVAIVRNEGGATSLAIVHAARGEVVGRIEGDGSLQNPAWSPDGDWLAYTCETADGRSRVCASSPRGRDRRVVAEVEGGHAWLPRWVPSALAEALLASDDEAPEALHVP